MPKTVNDVYCDEFHKAAEIASRLLDMLVEQLPSPDPDVDYPITLAAANHATKIRRAFEDAERCILSEDYGD